MDAAPDNRADGATDFAIALLLGMGAACWSGLVLGQLGAFRLAPIAAIGVTVFLASLTLTLTRHRQARAGSSASSMPRTPASARWRAVDGPLVLVLVAALYLPGYDATLYGTDATVYWGVGARLAETGSLATEDATIGWLPWRARYALFPTYTRRPGSPRQRSIGGLSFTADGKGPVFSTFSQLPSVWLAIGFAAGGLAGGLAVTPLLGAAGVMAFYLVVRRLSGIVVALVATGLLTAALPQVFYARFPMGEVGGQFFLWSALLALSRWQELNERPLAIAAGIGFGLAALARPEYLVLVPIAVVLLWILRPVGRTGIPLATVATGMLLFAHASLLLLYFVPTHYGTEIMGALYYWPRYAVRVAAYHALLTLLAAALLIAATLPVARYARRYGVGSPAIMLRAAGTGLLVVWVLLYVYSTREPGGGLRILPFCTHWVVLALGAAGLPILARRWWADPGGRLALLVIVVVSLHFLYGPHTRPMPLWTARRLLPATLPLVFACTATAAVAAARFWRPAALGIAALALVTNFLPARRVWGRPFFRGTTEAVTEIANQLPFGAIVLIDAGLLPALLDVPLLLAHDRRAIQLRDVPGGTDTVRGVARVMPYRPVYLIRQGLLAPPSAPGLRFTLVGAPESSILLPGSDRADRSGVDFYTRFVVQILRVERDRGQHADDKR
jgi:hypothetical protein